MKSQTNAVHNFILFFTLLFGMLLTTFKICYRLFSSFVFLCFKQLASTKFYHIIAFVCWTKLANYVISILQFLAIAKKVFQNEQH